MTQSKVINKVVGWTFVLIGVVGIILPILQGFLFFIVGLLFLSKEYVWAGKVLAWLKQKINGSSPKLGKVFDDAERILQREAEKFSSDPHYLRKRFWLLIALVLALALIGWLLALIFGWLKDLIFG